MIIKKLLVASLSASMVLYGNAQGSKTTAKPYKIQIAGKQLTIKSNKPIQQVMIWTTEGHRVVEQKNINNNFFSIELTVNRKVFYLMIGLTNTKIFTEKIGIL